MEVMNVVDIFTKTLFEASQINKPKLKKASIDTFAITRMGYYLPLPITILYQ